MKKIAFLLAIFAFGLQLLFAQIREITGTVTSAEDGSPIPGVSVTVKGTTLGTVTNVEGKYHLKTPQDAKTLTFSFVGMETKEVVVSGPVINVILESGVVGIEEIVVTGYGSGQKIGSIVGSIATVKSDQIENKPSPNIVDALQGKVPGVMIYTSSGEPSETSSIIIRGAGTLEGNTNPLIILDGVAVNNTTIMAINPNDFESVTVLKDASATSIYGSRAANGVIVYTTKKGKKGEKGKITVDGMYGVSNMAESKLWDNLFDAEGLLNFWQEAGFYSESTIETIRETYPNNTNWRDYYYQGDRKLYEANLSYSGGNEKTDYFVSFGLHDQEGLAYRSKFDRYSTRFNLNTSVNQWFDAGVNMNIAYTEQNKNPYGLNSTNTGLTYLAPPFYSPYDENGGEYYDQLIPGWNRYSLSYLHDMFPYSNNKVQLTGNTYAQISPVKGLKIKTLNSADAYDQNETSKRSAKHIGYPGNGYTNESRYRKYQFQTTNTAEYSWNIDDLHQFSALVGQEWIKDTYETMYAGVYGIEDDRLSELDSGTGTKEIASGKSEYAYLSYFGRFNYSCHEKYFGDVTVRRDESSLLAQNNRDGWFFSVGGRWKLKEENFMRDVDWMSKLDLRVSYGTQGRSEVDLTTNFDAPYRYYSLVGSTKYAGSSGWLISTFGNPNLGWEKQKQLSVGIETSAFNNRLSVILEAYDKRNEDLHISVPYPYTSGVTSVMKNAASLKNTGIELAVSYHVLKGKDYDVEPYINFAYNKEEVTKLFPEANNNGQYWPMDSYCFMWTVGQPQTYYVPLWAGVNPDTGAPQWYVPGDDPSKTVKDPDNVTSTFSSTLSQNIGKKYHPNMNGGFGLRAHYKDFAFQADFSFQLNKYLLNNDGYFAMNPTVFSSFNQSDAVLDYWKEAGDVTRFPSLDYQFTQFDSRLVEDASFLRLKSLLVSYSIPSAILDKTNFFGSARVFLTGRNLLTWTKYSGQDPEVDSNLTYGQNPNTKQISVGLSLTF
jgi:TonB-linked SusC/RagA family outer membrane protein